MMDPKLCLYASGANIKGKDTVERKDVHSIICVSLYVSQNTESAGNCNLMSLGNNL